MAWYPYRDRWSESHVRVIRHESSHHVKSVIEGLGYSINADDGRHLSPESSQEQMTTTLAQKSSRF